MELLKLAALDAEDLAVISAHLQDAILRAGDFAWLAGERRFVMVGRRFDRATAPGEAPRRRLAGVHFERVMGVKTRGIVPGKSSDETLSLLAITFEPSEPPSGTITLVFAGGAAIRLDVECIEVRMKDLGPIWEAEGRPDHDAEQASRAALQGQTRDLTS
ncbi:DUF2948 family protein [Methylobacterium gnaphalii]|uniref:DUF2948 domain-containing protein n=1 Tax=Methylobacterium gnaphalii TaxID=1010610 RepID=A0A512JRL4_9HYPH|nr:DUF2948 family protein [Methylobacterium gnaphalii]GEP12608.1 hypothetical protein MGN01_44530 [Methylobacterium gnaphalii]GJD71301.1 hypothetical protein MMMDOFMJ_4256 [Methylobacterium gnaphalii]GLS48042.1 hypothetical protein GCM10007885_08860 [Methylobacterium gnaphalii]